MKRLHTRVDSGIVLDAGGRFRHDGEPIDQPAIERAFHRGLARTADGRYLVRFGNDWAYVLVEDAPYQVERAIPEGDRIRLLLDDGTNESLDPGTLTVSSQGPLYCLVKGDHRARLRWQAQADLGAFLEEPEPGRFGLILGGRAFPIGSHTGRPPPRPQDGPPPPDDAPGSWTPPG